MRYTKEMFLFSASGYCMPYSSEKCAPQPLLEYGHQVHPRTKEKFFHHGLDLTADDTPLLALASGVVSGMGSDPVHDGYINVRYGGYEVKYGHVTEAYVTFGTPVVAGMPIACSGDMLHLGVRFKGEEIDPKDFLAMLYDNVMSQNLVGDGMVMDVKGEPLHTEYDADMDEINRLMLRYLPLYMDELRKGSYRVTESTERSLLNLFTQSAKKNYYFESLPSMSNPLGLSGRSAPLAAKVQSLIISDFLNYLGVRHSVFLSTWNDGQKKKFLKEAADEGRFIDPFKDFDILVHSFDVPRIASVYPDNAGIRWWTKAWFNNRENGEDVVEISREMAIKFIKGEISKDAWLERFYPKQMSVYHNAIDQTRKQLLGI